MSDLKEQRAEAYDFAHRHQLECWKELIEWQETGLLRDGRVRELAKLLSFAKESALSMAKSVVEGKALEFAVDAHGRLRGRAEQKSFFGRGLWTMRGSLEHAVHRSMGVLYSVPTIEWLEETTVAKFIDWLNERRIHFVYNGSNVPEGGWIDGPVNQFADLDVAVDRAGGSFITFAEDMDTQTADELLYTLATNTIGFEHVEAQN